jgi:hypothetical protein
MNLLGIGLLLNGLSPVKPPIPAGPPSLPTTGEISSGSHRVLRPRYTWWVCLSYTRSRFGVSGGEPSPAVRRPARSLRFPHLLVDKATRSVSNRLLCVGPGGAPGEADELQRHSFRMP